jgi:hypothetical protein
VSSPPGVPGRSDDQGTSRAASAGREHAAPARFSQAEPVLAGSPPRPPELGLARWSSAWTPVLAVGLACLIGAAFFIASAGNGTPAASPTASNGLIAAGAGTEWPTVLPPTPGPTPTPTATATPTPTRRPVCPSPSAAASLIGGSVEIVPNESCAFTWRYDGTTRVLRCPEGWECEISPPSETVVLVIYGLADPLHAVGGTWRYLTAYPDYDPVHDKCAFLAEVEAGAKPNSWTAKPVGFTCS